MLVYQRVNPMESSTYPVLDDLGSVPVCPFTPPCHKGAKGDTEAPHLPQQTTAVAVRIPK